MLMRVPDNVKEATTDSPWPDVTAIPLEFGTAAEQILARRFGLESLVTR